MNKLGSIFAFVFFVIAWALSISGVEYDGFVNGGLMWLALAAVIGRD